MTGRVLVTGANGFIGGQLCRELLATGLPIRRCTRMPERSSPDSERCESVAVGDINALTSWHKALAGIHAVVHLAARVHVMHGTPGDPAAAYREVNVAGSERLARSAVRVGIRRLVFVSSIKVNGERTNATPFRDADRPMPQGPYAASKWEAEQRLKEISQQGGMELVVVRPPLVYGPGVKGNFLRLMRLVQLGVPMPFGRIRNKRSFVGLTNLSRLLVSCILRPEAAGRIYLAGDGEDLSTPDLIRRLARSLDCKARLLPVPVPVVRAAGLLLGRRDHIDRLCDDLVVDAGNATDLMDGFDIRSVEDELTETARWYLARRGSASE